MPSKRPTIVCAVAAFAFILAGCETTSVEERRNTIDSSTGLDVNPKLSASTYYSHGFLLERQGNFDQAVRQYNHALKVSPDFVSARNRLGITYNKLGRHPEATAQFEAAVARDPRQGHLYNNLGFSHYLQGQYAQAEEALRNALELRPTFRRARMNLGLVLARQQRYDEAFAEFSLAGDEADAYYNLAMVQTQCGDYVQAAQSLEKALHVNPRFTAAREHLHTVARLAAGADAQQQKDEQLVAAATPDPKHNPPHNAKANHPENPQEDTATNPPKSPKQQQTTPSPTTANRTEIEPVTSTTGTILLVSRDNHPTPFFVGPPTPPRSAGVADQPEPQSNTADAIDDDKSAPTETPHTPTLTPKQINQRFNKLIDAALNCANLTWHQIVCELEQYLYDHPQTANDE